MEYLINEELIPMIDDSTLSLLKIRSLISLKEFIDRISGAKFLEDSIIKKVLSMHDKMPAVITWGDYFQVKLAFELQGQSDEDFIKAIETVKFDVIASFEIFSDKNTNFFEWVENNLLEKNSRKNLFSKEEYDEAVHLNILKEYFLNMKIQDGFTFDEKCWFNNFKEAVAV